MPMRDKSPATLSVPIKPPPVDLAIEASQKLWGLLKFEDLVKRFTRLLRDSFGVREAMLMGIENNGNRHIALPHPFKLEGVELFSENLVKALASDLGTMDFEAGEWRDGLTRLVCHGSEFAAISLGDVQKSHHIFLWRIAETKIEPERQRVLDFIVSQLQNEARWFAKLDKTQELVYRDDLTGLFNHRYLDFALENELRRVQRFQMPFCVLFVDVDNFKSVNDQHGHLTGSSLLRQIANVLRAELREVDVIIRYGGDEFIVLLINSDSHSGLRVAQRIRQQVEKTSFRMEDDEARQLTVSIGVASCPEHGRDKETLLKLADQMMYAGKRQGKNLVMSLGREMANLSSEKNARG